MARFFLSYRRDDSAGFAGRLADDLEARFGIGSVFRDVDDLTPGVDFVDALEHQVRIVDAVLVMIGPRWLDAVRLNDADDFVRREIETALASDKPVLPVLVGGARMPAQAALPPSLQPLMRRQAMTLSDADWKHDVEILAGTLARMAPARAPVGTEWRLGLALAGIALVTLVSVFTGLYLAQRDAPRFADKELSAAALAAVTGHWVATVRYEWGDTHRESFDFIADNGRLTGSAGYLGRPAPMEDVEFDGTHLSFTTRSQETMGSDAPWKEVTHRYTGEVTPDGIRFTLMSSGGYTLHRPLSFVAQRVRP
jgi:hypothetical protein